MTCGPIVGGGTCQGGVWESAILLPGQARCSVAPAHSREMFRVLVAKGELRNRPGSA